jgi:hypothetical protein
MIAKLWTVFVLICMLTLPGWAMLAASNTWRQWKGLQRWILALSLSIAFYPLLFYGLRFAIPFLTLGPYKMSALLLAFAALIAWRMRKHWRAQFALSQSEWVAVGVFAATLFTRFWIIREQPFPAWSDSLHHTLLTQLTAQQGQFPVTMEPYFPVPLGQYHLGLYSLSATVQWLARVPAHTALLWTAQVLNGLCVLGVYLVLDRKVGRIGALAGAVIVGLLSHQPAFYVNWGRFTQISSQAILLVAWLVTWEAVSLWQRPWREYRIKILWNTAFAAALCGAVFLLHFRVAAFLLPLLAITIAIELWRARKDRTAHRVVLGICAIGFAGLLLIFPALWEAASTYVTAVLGPPALSEEEISQTINSYFRFSWRSVPSLAAHPWLIALATLGAVIGLLKRNEIVIISILWTLMLAFMGYAFVLGNSLLSITNLGAVLIMLYLPIALVVGAAVQELVGMVRIEWQPRAVRLLATLGLAAAFVASFIRVTDVEPYRYFVTPEDLQAMRWIRENTPTDAKFAVNTYFWLPNAPHGTDAGYWIPYLTGRQTTVDCMLLNLGSADYASRIVEMSHAVEQLETSGASLDELYALGVDYVYIGQRGDFSGPGLSAQKLAEIDGAELVYSRADVRIIRIERP